MALNACCFSLFRQENASNFPIGAAFEASFNFFNRRRAVNQFVGCSTKALAVLVLFVLIVSAAHAQAPAEDPWAKLQPGTVVLFRHANAPGNGDPPGFKLNDCVTQRNLDELGRAQARRIGEVFRQRKIKVGAVLTSQWCRTRETAELAFPQLRRDDSDFNSFFADRGREPVQTAAARAKLMRWRGPGVMVVITHQVNISALTDIFPQAGEGIVLQPAGKSLKVLARIQP